MIRFSRFFISSAVSMIAFGGQALASDGTPPGTLFVCDKGQPYVQVLVPHNQDLNAILMLESEQFEMTPTRVGSGYGADMIVGPHHWMIHGKGPTDLLLMKDDDDPKTCRVVDAGNSQTSTGGGSGVVSAMGNYSLGGNVRSGPGTDYAKVDALPYGEPVVLLERSGVHWDGYEWFKIEFSEGLTGYQWGGIMCSNALHITGLYDPCPNDLN